ncbi:hypothetical protein ACFLWA_03045 [Chloroflexota bacterium]
MQRLRSVKSPIARGMLLGAIAGFALSAIYGGLVLLFLLALMIIRAPGTPIGDYAIQLSMASATAGFAIPCIGVLAVMPGTLWGALLGLLISAPVTLLNRVLSPVKSALLGAAVAAALAACWPFLFPFATTAWIETRTYLLYQGAPSLISIVAGGWIAYGFYRSLQE